ncbi:FkbM family methyltransferase [Cryptosporangium sp. NPDC048952]|uniref:FkbM family methyltransferase n=1 Tax=Cryptosporangium sp. NPDC048952 TaxID=3363961 RepID=UPI0037153C6A
MTATARTRFGSAIPVTTTDLIQRYLYLFGSWEPNLTHWISTRIRPGDTVIDVGAHIGYFTLLAAHLTGPTGQIVAIEAAPHFHEALTQALVANDVGNVRAVQAAVSDRPGHVTLYLPDPANLGNTTMVAPSAPPHSWFETDAQTLPNLLTDQELTTARIIKIDVEGAEAATITGLAPDLHRLHPAAELAIEISPRLLRKQGHCVNDVLEPLLASGFHAYLLANDYQARSYPGALRKPNPPVRLHPPYNGLKDPSDLVLSRTDAGHLP